MDPSTSDRTEMTRRQPGRFRAWLQRRLARLGMGTRLKRPRRILFLDDNPVRAQMFEQDHPQAIWVTTVADCLARLEETWDEIHLDHDLGGKIFVDSRAEDCGMEVIRWLCKQPRRHLEQTQFFVHTHNAAAGLLMVLQMRVCGYKGEFRPFGIELVHLLAQNEPPPAPEAPTPRLPRGAASGWWARLSASWRWLARRKPQGACERE
jgi:hypothetical protein